ncbi:MAG TPA: DUF1902 domain-containing protein [Stellaceae bacterium]|jgi:hypothetical protein|nr:DUF1902 domain-containing protein [Stellaceae bacterium]
MTTTYTVHAHWDAAAKIWWTDGDDIPGLFCEAESFDMLVDVILDLAPDLLRANTSEPPGEVVEIMVMAERHGRACIAA